MPSITVLSETGYENAVKQAAENEGKPRKEFIEGTHITTNEMIGNVVQIQQGYERTLCEVTEIDVENGIATLSELFTDREFTEKSNDTMETVYFNFSLPTIGSEHTVKWLEARIDDGEWEQVSDTYLDTAMNSFTRLKNEYETTRVVKKTYTHNPQDLCEVRIRPNKTRDGGTTSVDASQFTDTDLYNELMNRIEVPDTCGKYTRIGTLYTRSNPMQHDAEREHEIIYIQTESFVDTIPQPGNRVLDTDTPIEEYTSTLLQSST